MPPGIRALLFAVAVFHLFTCACGAGEAARTPEEGAAEPPAAGGRQRPPAPAARERVEERRRMVDAQIAHPRDGRRVVKSAAVLEAMRAAPRHAFVPAELAREAYADSPLPIGHGQTISQPYIVAWMTELLDLKPDSKVLEIGTGSGYQVAVLAHLTPNVYTIEIIEPLYQRARKALEAEKYTEVRCRRADGYHGWPEEAPFDAIIVTCAAGHLPPPLWEQLKPGGRIVVPIGGAYELQRLVVVTKTEDGKRKSATMPSFVSFVPLTREKGDGEMEKDRAREGGKRP